MALGTSMYVAQILLLMNAGKTRDEAEKEAAKRFESLLTPTTPRKVEP